MKSKKLWEILVPAVSNKGVRYSVKYHNIWDSEVRRISGGMTILRTARGQWISPEGEIFYDKMIPVRILCTENEINKIIDLTIRHYNQLSVLAYEISSNVKLVRRKD